MQLLSKIFWFSVAALFLIEAWLWDHIGGLLLRLAALIPFDAFKVALASWLDRLPPALAFVAFAVPIILLEPLKVVAIWLMGHEHILAGVLTFIFAEVVTVGVVAFLFDAMRGKLLSLRWFHNVYDWVLRARSWADDLLLPYKLKLAAGLASLGLWAQARLAAHVQSPFIGRLIALRGQARQMRKRA